MVNLYSICSINIVKEKDELNPRNGIVFKNSIKGKENRCRPDREHHHSIRKFNKKTKAVHIQYSWHVREIAQGKIMQQWMSEIAGLSPKFVVSVIWLSSPL